MLLTESQEGGEDTSELHCSCGGGGGVACRRRSEWTGFEVDRMESGGEIAERCPLLNTSRRSSRTACERRVRYQNGNKPSARKGKRQPPYEERRVAALSEKGRCPKTEG